MVSSLIVTIILISVLVIAHEFGHFIVAKKKRNMCAGVFAWYGAKAGFQFER